MEIALENTNPKSVTIRKGRYFFVSMAILFPILTVLGFVPDYQMFAQENIQLHWFLHVHGLIMTAWLGIFLAQTVLIAKDNVKVHRKLGPIGFVLGILVWSSLVGITVRALIVNNPPELGGQFDILFIQLYLLVLFGIFFVWGMRVRKQAAAHKRLLLLATLIVIQASIDRIRFLPGLEIAVFIRFIYLDMLLIPLFVYDWLSLRRIHFTTWFGALIIVIFQTGITLSWSSPGWHHFWFTAITPFVERLPEIKLTDAQSDLLLGNYGDQKWHLTLSRQAGTLYLQLPGNPRWELGATSETDLFVQGDNWKLHFVKGSDSTVTKLVNDQVFKVWEVPRMP